MIPFLYVLFILSGAAGLFYESVWSRYLSLFVGHGAYAQVIVLVIFLGGMALGATVVSRRSERLEDPLRGYALVELAIGLIGLAFHDVIYLPVTGWAYDSLFPSLGSGSLVTAAKWLLASAMILPQSILLGTTFPLMSAGVLRRSPERPGTVLSLLYFTNSLGAAAGVLIAGFYLVRVSGLPGTLAAAAILNLLVGLAALIAAKYGPSAAARIAPGAAPEESDPADAAGLSLPTLSRLLLLAAAGTALASFIYEVAWIRLLSLVLGSATHSFELMLSAFILGLALGALWIRRRAETIRQPLRMLVGIQLAMGVLAIGSLALYAQSFWWTADLMGATARTPEGYTFYTMARYALCLVIMLPATFCAGMTLPLITRTLLRGGAGERAIGAVYGANTLGSIVGAALASLVLIPAMGLAATLVAGGILDMVVGLLIVVVLIRAGAPVRRTLVFGALATVVVPVVALTSVRLDEALLSSGVFRTGQVTARVEDMVFYQDGRTASVAVSRTGRNGRLTIGTNGKPDGSLDPVWNRECIAGEPTRPLTGDDPTQSLVGLVALAYRPDARNGVVIGQGTGMSSHMLLGSPTLETLVTVEIEPVMVEASRQFLPANRRVFEDPRARFVFDDAKAYFAAANQQFDLILAEPSNPWVSGVSGLFTSEFYGRLRRYLGERGILGQWIQTYELTDDLVLSVLGAIHQNFSDYVIYAVNGADLMIVATPTGRLPAPDWGVLSLPEVRRDLCHFHPITRQDVEAMLLTSRTALGPLLDGVAQPNSDFYPVLDLGAERARFLRSSARIAGLYAGVHDYTGTLAPAPFLPDTQVVSALQQVPRVAALIGGTALRRGRPSIGSDTGWALVPRQETDDQIRSWLAGLPSGGAPVNWATWARTYWEAFGIWHAGTRGWVDPAFQGPATAFVTRHSAPAPVMAATRFREGLARRDWPAVSAAGELLVSEALAGRIWVVPEAIMEGMVLAQVSAGRGDSAMALLKQFAPFFHAGADDDARRRLLLAYAVGSSGRPAVAR
jgi:predicted membrane-bound spermidine synthase